MSEIARRAGIAVDEAIKAKPVKSDGYLEWIRTLPCLVTIAPPRCEPAHLSTRNLVYGHMGRGKSQKSSDRWALPLSKEAHRQQHLGNERLWWKTQRINPYIAALTLHGLYTGELDGHAIATKMINSGAFRV